MASVHPAGTQHSRASSPAWAPAFSPTALVPSLLRCWFVAGKQPLSACDLGPMEVPSLSSGVTSSIFTNQTEAPTEELWSHHPGDQHWEPGAGTRVASLTAR